MNRYLLDTSICVALFRGRRNVARHLNEAGVENCFITDVVFAELLVGVYRSDRREENMRQLLDFANEVKVLPFMDSVDVFAQERVRLWNAGQKIEDFDLLIGCAAKARGLTMVTHNVKHFEHIEGLTIEDWV